MKSVIIICCFCIAGFAASAQTEQVVEDKSRTAVEVDDKIFTKVEVESTFPGGDKGWIEYLSANFKYPQKAIKKNISGTVIVQFIVDKLGKVSDVQVIKSVHPLLDEEAVRLIKKSPDWTPAQQNGRKVKSYKKQPITFKLT